MPSFDTVCEPNLVEVKNDVENAAKEIGTRFDFKGTSAAIELKDKEITLLGDAEFQLQQVDDILRGKLTKRNVDVRFIDAGTVRMVNAHSKLGLREEPMLLMEFHGSPAGVKEQAETVQAIADEFGGQAFTLLVQSLRRATRLAMTMEARGFGAGPRTWARPLHYGGVDVGVGAAVVLIAVGALVTSIALGTHRFIWQ